MNEEHLKWRVLDTKYLYKEQWFTVRSEKCERNDGKIIDPYYVFEFPEWVTVFALTEDEKVIMVKQYRHALGEVCIELPGGCVDDTDGSLEAAARRELVEETGYTFDTLHYLGRTSANPSTNRNEMHMFIALGGKKTDTQSLDENEEIIPIEYTIDELMRLIDERKIVQSMHVTTIFYALRHLKKLQYHP